MTSNVPGSRPSVFLRRLLCIAVAAVGAAIRVRTFKTGTYAFDVPKLPAGAYQFVCTLHPVAMTGMLTID
jgi:plastocyanin